MLRKLLCSLVLAALVTPAGAQRLGIVRGAWHYGTYADIPSSPVDGQVYVVTDAPSKTTCGAGGAPDGSTPAVCRWSDTDLDGTYDTWVAIGVTTAGSGDVTGPGSSTDNCIVRFNGATGKIIQEGTDCPTYDDSGNVTAQSYNYTTGDANYWPGTPPTTIGAALDAIDTLLPFTGTSRYDGANANAEMESAIADCSGDCSVAIPSSEGDQALDLRNIAADTTRVLDLRESGGVDVTGSWFGTSTYRYKGAGLYFRHSPPNVGEQDIYAGFEIGAERTGGESETSPKKDKFFGSRVFVQDRGSGEGYGTNIALGKYGRGDSAVINAELENLSGAVIAGDEGGNGVRVHIKATEVEAPAYGTATSYDSGTGTLTFSTLNRGSRVGVGRYLMKMDSGTYTTGTVNVTSGSSTVTGNSTLWVGAGKPCTSAPCNYANPEWCMVVTKDINDGTCEPWVGGQYPTGTNCTNITPFSPKSLRLVYPVASIEGSSSLTLTTTAQGASKGYKGFGGSTEAYTLYRCARITGVSYGNDSTGQNPNTTLTLSGYTGFSGSDQVEVHPHYAHWNNGIKIIMDDMLPGAIDSIGLNMTGGISAGTIQVPYGLYQDGYWGNGVHLAGTYGTAALNVTGGDVHIRNGKLFRVFSDSGSTETARLTGTTGALQLDGALTLGAGTADTDIIINFDQLTGTDARIVWDDSSSEFEFDFDAELDGPANPRIQSGSVLSPTFTAGRGADADFTAMTIDEGSGTDPRIAWDESEAAIEFDFDSSIGGKNNVRIYAGSVRSPTFFSGRGVASDYTIVEIDEGSLTKPSIYWDESLTAIEFDFDGNIGDSQDPVLSSNYVRAPTFTAGTGGASDVVIVTADTNLGTDAQFAFDYLDQAFQFGQNGIDGKLSLYSEQGGTDYTTIFQPGTQTQNITYTLPADAGLNTHVLQTNGSGVLSWVAPQAASFDTLTNDYGDETITSTWDMGGARVVPPNYTVTDMLYNLATPATNEVVVVTDGATAADCSGGGGVNRVWCYYNGSSWVSMGGAGVPGGSPAQLQYNSSGSFGGITQMTYDGANLTLAAVSGDSFNFTNATTFTPKADSVTLTAHTSGDYVATLADAGNLTVTVANGDTEGGAATIDVIDVNCTDCLGPTEITGFMPLAGGLTDKMTGQLFTDNLGIEFEESDTNPACATGNFTIWADLSEGKIKKCEDGASSDIGAVSGFMTGLVDDTTPQLGGMLDVNGFALGADVGGSGIATLELLKFSETTSAVNEFTIANAATGTGPSLSATGNDTNIPINITAKGTGTINFNSDVTFKPTSTPGIDWKDDDGDDPDINAQLDINLSAGGTGTGAEDADVTLAAQVAGAMTNIIDFDADDGTDSQLDIGVDLTGEVTIGGGNVGAVTVAAASTGDGEFVVPNDSIGPAEIDSTTGAYNFGEVSSFELPNGDGVDPATQGQIALDTLITDFSTGLWRYYDSNEKMFVIAVPEAEISPAPSNGHVLAYNATNDEFEFVNPTAGTGDVTDVGDCTGTDGGCFDGSDTTGSTTLYFEHSTPSTIETILTIEDPTSADGTYTLPDLAGGSAYIASDATKVTNLDGVGIGISSNALVFDSTELTTTPMTWFDGNDASVVWNWNLTAGDPQITFGNAAIRVSSGALQVGGATDCSGSPCAVIDAGDTGTVTGTMLANATVDQVNIDDTDTLGGNPAHGANSVWFATTGLIFEGATDTVEGLLTWSPTTTDRTLTLPDETGTLLSTVSTSAGITTLTGTTLTLGDGGNFTALTFDGGATDPVLTAGNGTLTLTNAALDMGGTTSVEIPNAATDLTLSAAGQVGINTTDEQLCAHSAADGEISGEVCISLLDHIVMTFDPAGYYDQESTYRVLPLMRIGDDMPEGITITEWAVDYVGGDPTTELDADLMCDTTPDYNPAAGATVMDVIDTTAGTSSADTGFDSASCANGSRLYIRFGADPTDANVMVTFNLWYYGEED